MTPAEIKRLRELCEKATPGPWYSGPPGRIGNVRIDHSQSLSAAMSDVYADFGALHSADADFVSAARTALPALLDEVERLQAEIRQLEKDHREDMRDAYAEGQWSEREDNNGY